MLYIAIDGTGVPMTAAETEGRDGKGDDGKARTREVKLCCCFTQTTTDEDGRPVRDPGSSSYLATFAPAAPFGTLMAAEARRRGAGHVRQLAVLGDGAVWIWNLAAGTSPKPPRSSTCSTPASTCTTWPGCWSSCSAVTTTPGSPGASLSSTPATSRHCCQPPASSRWPARKPGHWTPPWATSRPTPTACATQHFRSLGMFVGSGAVEAGCKAVIGQRLKLSGMRWSVPGAAGILALRCQQASGRWEEIWQHPGSHTGVA